MTNLSGAQADEALLRYIFSNLLSNAVKYSPAGSAVDFVVRRLRQDAVFTVQDRGIGIPEADQPRLFEAFNRATNVGQVSGSGLGLLIVRHCVGLHRGSIDFESRLGTGTTFTVRLPLFASEQTETERRAGLWAATDWARSGMPTASEHLHYTRALFPAHCNVG